jgi:hypothetical protein
LADASDCGSAYRGRTLRDSSSSGPAKAGPAGLSARVGSLSGGLGSSEPA